MRRVSSTLILRGVKTTSLIYHDTMNTGLQLMDNQNDLQFNIIFKAAANIFTLIIMCRARKHREYA